MKGQIGRGFLSQFQEPDTDSPIIVTTSKLLTTGVDVPTCKNIVIAPCCQINDRIQADYRAWHASAAMTMTSFISIFSITPGVLPSTSPIPDFDGYPALITEIQINSDGEAVSEETLADRDPNALTIPDPAPLDLRDPVSVRGKYYVDNVQVEIIAEMVRSLDAEGNQRMIKFTDYTAEQVRNFVSELRFHASRLETL